MITVCLSDDKDYSLYADIFSQAAALLLQDEEGIYIQSKRGSKYLVNRSDGMIFISELSDKEVEDIGFSHGRMVFVHNTEEKPNQKDIERFLYRKVKILWDQLTDQQKLDIINDEP